MRVRNRPFAVQLLVLCLLALVGISAGFDVSARQQKPSGCPKTTMSCPTAVRQGDKLMFTAEVKGGDQQVTPTYNWTVSAGQIESGQGTSTIEVSTKEVPAESSLTATVELGGYDRECGYGSTAASCTATIDKK
jgi:hypothetical protein